MARHVSDPANSTDIELRGERDSNEMTKQDTQFPDLAGSRMQASTTEKDDNAAHSSSLMLSIRQNLRAKLAATAERKASTEKMESYPMRRLGDLKSSKRSTRFDDDSIEEEPQMVHQEEKPKEVTQEFLLDSTASKWKQFAERSRAQAKETRLVESYQFFTTSFLEEEEEEAEVNSLEVTDGQRAANEESTQEEQLREGEGEQDDTHSRDALIEELERIGEEDSPAPETYGIVSSAATDKRSIFWGSPYFLDNDEWVKQEEKLLYSPSSTPVPSDMKLPSNALPRLKENEGFFIPERPKLNWGNYNRLEQRLVKQENAVEWFGEDGLVKMAGDPRHMSLRPDMVDYANNHASRSDLVAFSNATLPTGGMEEKGDDGRTYKLTVSVGQLYFSHHHLFSQEHVTASKLIGAYKHFMSKREQNRPRVLREKLNALRSLRSSLEQTMSESHGRDTQDRLSQCRRDIFQTLFEKKGEEETEFALFRDISRLWTDLKQIRVEQGYTSTTTKMVFEIEPCDAEREKIERAKDIEDEVLYRREEHENLIMQYKKAVKEYEKKIRRLRRKHARSTGGDQYSSEINLLADEVPAPQKPLPFSEEDVRAEIVRSYLKTVPPPESSRLVPKLEAMVVTPKQQCESGEQRRREDVGAMKYRLSVLVNGKEAARSSDWHLDQHLFVVRFKEIFGVKVRRWPSSLSLQVRETGSLGSHVLSEIYLPVPDGKETSANSLQQYQFSDCTTVSYLHNAVGGNVAEDGGVRLLTNGSISAAVHWERDDSGRVLCPPVPNATLLSNTGRAKVFPQYMDVMGATNIEALRSWIRESQLDPNDPENADLISLVNSVEGQETPKHFRLIELDDAARFVSDSAFENNRRFHLLSMRQKKHPGVKSKVMPATDEEVTDRMWKSIVAFETEDPYQPPCIVFDEFRSGSKEEREKYMAGIKEMVLKRVREATKEVSLSDVVYNELLPNVVNLKNAITSFFSPRRPLQPKRRTIREAQPSHVHITEASINIRVARAVNVPRRNGYQQLNNRTRSAESVTFRENFELGSSAQGLPMATGQLLRTDFPYMDIPVRPFVEVSFESSVARTTTVTGVNPHWNEELVLALVPPENDFSPVNLSKMNSFLHFNLYDEVVVDILKDERQRSTNIHHRLERKWLGSFSVPFSTLHANSRFEGSVTVNVPPLLLGYSQDQVEGMTTVEGESTLGSCCKTSLKIFVSVEPPLPTIPAIQHKFDSYESTEALMQADLWRRKLKEKFPHRHYQATALNAEGQNVFLTRYISPQNPPEQLLGEGDVASLNLMQHLARFVSLIPNLPDSRFFSRTCDIWTTSDQFLKMLAGDEEEHAILLCNYFLFTCIPSWVVLGNGVPEGSTAYVLSGHPTGVGFLLWDPCTGEHYQQYDPHCPLTTVGCIFDSQNVWGNIQSFDDPGRMNLDVLSGKQWAPLFKDDVPVLSSLQVEDLQYHDSNPDQIGHIEKQLDTLVMNRIQTWRTEKAQITRWNRHATSVLKSALQRCEEKFGTQIEFEDGGFEDLRVLATTYKMSGFPIQVRHNNSEEILEKLKFTGIHLCEDERVEYARAVYIHSYPSDVISIWIYVATLKRD